jgi:hypothetical protein
MKSPVTSGVGSVVTAQLAKSPVVLIHIIVLLVDLRVITPGMDMFLEVTFLDSISV